MSRFSNYYGKNAEDPGIIHKVLGVAKTAGIIALGLVATKPLLKYAGRSGIGLLGELSNAGKLGIRDVLSSEESVINSQFSREVQSIFNISEELGRQPISAVTRSKRIEDFLDGLAVHVTPETESAYNLNKDKLVPHLSAIGRASRGSEAEETFLKTPILEKFNAEAKHLGISFNFKSVSQQETAFRKIIDDRVKATAEKKALIDLMSSPKNRQTVVDWMKRSSIYQKSKATAAKRVLGLSTMEDITWGQLENKAENVATRRMVEQHLERIHALNHLEPGESRVDALLSRTHKSLDKLFSYEEMGGMHSYAEKDQVLDLLRRSNTGLMVDKDHRIVSLNALGRKKDAFLEKAGRELQVPLVPYAFQIPLQTFKGLFSPTKEIVADLGFAAHSPELMRIAEIRSVVTPHTKLMQAGDAILALTPNRINEEGSEGVLELLPGKFTSIKKRTSPHHRKLSQVRGEVPEDFFHTLRTLREEHSKTKFNNYLYESLPHIADLRMGPNGFEVRGKNAAFQLAVGKLFPKGRSVDIENIHPLMLSEFMKTHAGNIEDQRSVFKALNHLINEAKQAPIDASGTLKHISDLSQSNKIDLRHIGGADFWQMFHRLLGASDNAQATIDLLNLPNLRDKNNARTTLTNLTSDLFHTAATPFYQAINMLRKDQEELLLYRNAEGGIAQNIVNKIMGSDNLSHKMELLQEGLLAETVHGLGLSKISKLVGSDIERGVISIKDQVESGTIPKHALIDALDSRGFKTPAQLRDVMSQVIDYRNEMGQDVPHINLARLGELGTLLLDSNEVTGLSDNQYVKAKMLDSIAKNLDSISGLDITQKNARLTELVDDFGIVKTIQDRFKPGRPWLPKELLDNPLSDARYSTFRTNIPSLSEFLNKDNKDKIELFKDLAKQGFGVGDYLKSMAYPDQALGQFGAMTQIMLQMPHHIAQEVGFGLPTQDRITLLRSSLGFLGKRVLPLYIGVELYKNYNANMHHFGLPGIDDMAANLIGNARIDFAKVRDTFGLTESSKRLVNLLPGLDQYQQPRSEQEERDYLLYGNEGVREGRGWIIGSRLPLVGGKVSYFRPNFYRRWTSHWTEASNVDISNPNYSFLPNLQNPLAPLNLLVHPHWFQHKHIQDRPYIGGGNEPAAFTGTGWMINSNNSFGPLAIGAFGGGYPAKMTGAGEGVILSGGTYSGQGNGTYPGYGHRGGVIHSSLHKEIPIDRVEEDSLHNFIAGTLHTAREQMGIYGAVMQRLPFYPEETGAFEAQDYRKTRSLNRMLWMGDYGEASGLYGDFIRRFIPQESQDTDAYSPYTNNMPSWLPSKFQNGDPYTRTEMGELNLPGEAFIDTHPWLQPLRVRGSVLGGTEQEIIEKWLNPTAPLEGEDAEDIVEFGSTAHKLIQRQLKDAGILVGAEVSVFDKEHNISGTLDAIIRGENGAPEIIDIKTQGDRSWGHVPENYRDQLTAYMAITGIHQAKLAFVNRDNPTETRFENVEWDPNRWQGILDRIEHARSTVSKLVDEGYISPFETYDLLSRIEILSKVAPDSYQFREIVEFAQKGGGFGGFEAQRFHQALDEAAKLKQDYNTYPKVYGLKTDTRRAKVMAITDNGEIVTNLGVIKLAGVKFDAQAFIYEDPEEVLSKFGVRVGGSVPVTLINGQFNAEVMNDTTSEAIVGDVNSRLIRSDYAAPDLKSRSPLSHKVVAGSSLLGSVWEHLVHLDNPITNKFMRVRTPLEQFKRGEVYGTDKSRVGALWNTIIKPSVNSFISKDPISAAMHGAFIGGMFFGSKEMRIKGATVGAVAMASLSMIRSVRDLIAGNKWTPKSYRDQNDLNEYWDILEYIKYTRIAEGAKRLAKQKEHIDIDKLESGSSREFGELGPFSVLAINAERRARSTMYGFDVAKGTLQQAIGALPSKHQQLAEEIIKTGSVQEKNKFYELLPDTEKRILAKFLDQKNNKDRPDLAQYFKHHFLPDSDWGGYSPNSDINDLKTRSQDLEDVNKPNRRTVEKARAYSDDVSIPRMDNPTVSNIKRRIHEIIVGGYDNIRVDYKLHSSNKHIINVSSDVFEDKTNDLLMQMRQKIRS